MGIGKRKGCCGCNPFGCLLTIIIIIVLIGGGIVGGAYYAYETYGKEYTGLEFGELIDVLQGLLTANEDDIVVNPYNAVTDLQSFYDAFRNAAYIADDVDFSFIDIVNSTTNAQGELEGEENNPMSNIRFDRDKLLADLENVEDGEDYVPKVLEVTDKEVAALLNEVLTAVLNGEYSLNDEENGDGEDITDSIPFSVDLLKLEQVVVNTTNDISGRDATLSITISFALRQLLTSLAQDNLPEYANTIEPLINVFAEKFFITLQVEPFNEDGQAGFRINSMTDVQADNLTTLIETAMGKFETQFSLNNMLQQINNTVVQAFASIDNMVPVHFVDSGMAIKPIEALLKMFNNNVAISEQELMTTLKALLIIDEEVLVPEEKKPTENTGTDFISRFKTYYAIMEEFDLTVENFLDNDTIQAMIDHISFYESEFDFYISYEDMKVSLDGKELAVLIKSQMSSQDEDEESEQIDAEESEDDIFDNDSFSIEIMEILKNSDNEYALKLTISLNFKQSMSNDDNDNDNNFMDIFMPDKIYFTTTTLFFTDDDGYILNLEYDEEDINTEVSLNHLDAEKSEEKISVLNRLMGGFSDNGEDAFDTLNLAANIEKALKNVINSISESDALGVSVIFGEVDDNAVLLLPSVYEIIQYKGNVYEDNPEENEVVSLADIQATLMAITLFEEENIILAGYSESDGQYFINELKSKYSIVDVVDPQNDVIGKEDYNSSNISDIEIEPYNFTHPLIIGDLVNRMLITIDSLGIVEDMYVYIFEKNLAGILSYEFNKQTISTSNYDLELKEVRFIEGDVAGEYYLETVIKVIISENESSQAIVANLFSRDLYITSRTLLVTDSHNTVIDYVYDSEDIRTTLLVNEKNEADSIDTFSNLNKLMQGYGMYGESSAMDYDTIKSDIDRLLRNTLQNINSNPMLADLKLDNVQDSVSGEERLAFIMSSIYEIIEINLTTPISHNDIRDILMQAFIDEVFEEINIYQAIIYVNSMID